MMDTRVKPAYDGSLGKRTEVQSLQNKPAEIRVLRQIADPLKINQDR